MDQFLPLTWTKTTRSNGPLQLDKTHPYCAQNRWNITVCATVPSALRCPTPAIDARAWPETGLRGHRRPREPRIPFRLRAMPLPPPLDPTPFRRIRTLEPVARATAATPAWRYAAACAGARDRRPTTPRRSQRTPNRPASGQPCRPDEGRNPSPRRTSATVVQDTCSSRAIRAWLMPCPSNCLIRCCISIDVVNPFPPGNLENGYQHPGIYQETGRHRCPIPQPTTPSKMNATTVQK